MPNARISVSQLKQLIQLRSKELTTRAIARALSLSHGAVSKYGVRCSRPAQRGRRRWAGRRSWSGGCLRRRRRAPEHHGAGLRVDPHGE